MLQALAGYERKHCLKKIMQRSSDSLREENTTKNKNKMEWCSLQNYLQLTWLFNRILKIVSKMNSLGGWKTTFIIDSFGFPIYAQRLHQRLVFWNSIHQEVASDPFCFLINYSWLLVFILYVFSLFFSGFNLYCWKGIHFS